MSVKLYVRMHILLASDCLLIGVCVASQVKTARLEVSSMHVKDYDHSVAMDNL